MKISLRSLELALGITVSAMSSAACTAPDAKFLSYNIQNLPSEYADFNPDESIPEIINKLNEQQFDVVGIQENWMPSRKVLHEVKYPYRAPTPTACKDAGYTGEKPYDWQRCDQLLEDEENYKTVKHKNGLTIFSKFPMKNYRAWKWNACYGLLDNDSDCAAPKGIACVELLIELEEDKTVSIDTCVAHSESGGSEGDIAARTLQNEQFTEIMARSAYKPAIILWDTNMDEEFENQFLTLLSRSGFHDACRDLGCPEPYAIDRILYRNPIATPIGWKTDIEPIEWYRPDGFLSKEGEPLSDHYPIAVEFGIWVGPPGYEDYTLK